MTDNKVCFTVPGQPVGKARPKAARRGNFITMYTPKKTVNYESLVAHSAYMAMNGRSMFVEAVSVELDIRVQIPESWSKKKQMMAMSGALMPTKKPDIDNVEKGIFDGLNGVVWKDDVQVVKVLKRKRYHETPGVDVIICELNSESL